MEAKRKGKKWTPEQKARFQATMATKRGRKVVGHTVVTSIPLDAIPRKVPSTRAAPKASGPSRLQVVAAIVALLHSILTH